MNYLTSDKINGPDKDVGLGIKVDFDDFLFGSEYVLDDVEGQLDLSVFNICKILNELLHQGGLSCLNVKIRSDCFELEIHGKSYRFYDYKILYREISLNGEISELVMALGENADVLHKSLYHLKRMYCANIKWINFKDENMSIL